MDHQKAVLAGIIPENRDHLLYALQHLSNDHFKGTYKLMYAFLDQYHDKTGAIATKKVFLDWAKRRNFETAKLLVFEETFMSTESYPIQHHEFIYSVDALKDIRANQLTGEAIVEGLDVLQRPVDDNPEENGHQAARALILEQFGVIEQMTSNDLAPEGDMRYEVEEMLREYLDRKEGKVETGVLTGIAALDDVTGGFGRGELSLIAAYTSQGKSQLSTQTMWHAATQQGLNTFMATTETVRSTVRRRILARHSRLPQFNYPQGLNSKRIKDGALDEEGERVLGEVMEDLRSNPDYGDMHIIQVPQGAGLSYISARMNRYQQTQPMGLCVIDYLALLRSERRRDSEREEFNEILRAAKVLATSFDQGNGVPIVSPWQLRQSKFEEASKSGLYGLSSLSDTSEAEKTSDLIVTLLRLPETPSQATLQILKNRDGEIPTEMILDVDYRSTYLASRGDDDDFGMGMGQNSFGL